MGQGRCGSAPRGWAKRGVFKNVTFDLHAGEIYCITGLISSKRTELIRTLFGSDSFDTGVLELSGRRSGSGRRPVPSLRE